MYSLQETLENDSASLTNLRKFDLNASYENEQTTYDFTDDKFILYLIDAM